MKIKHLLIPLIMIYAIHCSSMYKVVETNKNVTSIRFILQYTGTQDYYLKPTSPIIKKLDFIFQVHTYSDFNIKIKSLGQQRFQVPQGGIFPVDPFANFSFPILNSAVTFEYNQNPFYFRVIRKSNNAKLFCSYDKNFIFSEYYLQIGSEIDSEYVYGMGERLQEGFRIKDGKWTIFNKDRGEAIDTGIGIQTYGYQPFYLLRQNSNYFHINYIRSSNAMDIIKQSNQGIHTLTYKIIGGIFDFRFFLAEKQPDVAIQKFNTYNGRSLLPPFWSFGFHQSRYGYRNVSMVQNVLSNYQKYGIPLDTIWIDIDYMIKYEVFTIDETRFPLDALKQITERYRLVPIIDPGIKNIGQFYEEGLKRNVYIMDANNQSSPFIGRVRPGYVTFVDFFHPNATQYWIDMLAQFNQKLDFSGIWLDMNEVTSYCDGPCFTPMSSSIFDYSKDLPYSPGYGQLQQDLISLNATHYGGLVQADVHAFYPLLQSYATYKYLKDKGVRPFVLTRSSTFGANKYAIHWSGDNSAAWADLKGSIADCLNAQMWGFQMFGADICGYALNATQQICARWYQLGSVYTFSRSHNGNDYIDQQPFALGEIVLQSAINNLKLRYALLKHYYSLFVKSRGLGTIWKPIFAIFPLDDNVFLDQIADTQFMVGRQIMVTPILEKGVTSRNVYFPESNWYDLHEGKKYKKGNQQIRNIKLTDKIPLFLRQGFGVMMQSTKSVVNTKQLNNRFILYCGLKLNENLANDIRQIYQATVLIMSIQNYNDDSKLDLCYASGCEYSISTLLTLSEGQFLLQLDVKYFGVKGLNQTIMIDSYQLYYGDSTKQFLPQQPTIVNGPGKIILKTLNNSLNLLYQQK